MKNKCGKFIRIIIEKNNDAFWAYAENEEKIVGGGLTVDECKQDILDCIETLKDFDKNNKPKFLDSRYNLVYQIDTQSFLEYYGDIITRASLSRLTGINEKQLGHYIQGLHKPRKDNAKKIEKALRQLGNELLSVELV